MDGPGILQEMAPRKVRVPWDWDMDIAGILEQQTKGPTRCGRQDR